MITLNLPPHKKIEKLISSANFNIRLNRYGIISLGQRIKELRNTYGLVGLVAFIKVISLQHPGNRILGSQTDDFLKPHFIQPFPVIPDLCFFLVKYGKCLFLIRYGVFLDFFHCQHWSCCRTSRRVSYSCSKITDNQDDLMA